jgi:DNA-binding CsgD family transcriptional regulator
MQAYKDLANNTIVRNYIAMPDRLQFCANDVAVATGVNLKTVRNLMTRMVKTGELIALPKRVSGQVYYRIPVEADALAAELKRKNASAMAEARGISRQRMSQILARAGVASNGHSLSPREYSALMSIADGKPHPGYDVVYGEAIVSAAKKGFATVSKAGRFNIYQITELGQEVINAKS